MVCSLEWRRWWALFFAKNRYNYSPCTLWFPFLLFVVRKRWGHEAQLMCTISAYLRSLRGIIPLIVSPGNAPALLLIVSRKHNLRVKQEKWKDRQKTKYFTNSLFFQSKLRLTFYSVSSVKIYSPSESLCPPKTELLYFIYLSEKRSWTSLSGGYFIFQRSC